MMMKIAERLDCVPLPHRRVVIPAGSLVPGAAVVATVFAITQLGDSSDDLSAYVFLVVMLLLSALACFTGWQLICRSIKAREVDDAPAARPKSVATKPEVEPSPCEHKRVPKSFTWSIGWLYAVGSLAMFQIAHAIEANLSRLHAPSSKAVGYRGLFDGHAERTWALWTDGVDKLRPFSLADPGSFVRWHVVADMGFVSLGLFALQQFVGSGTRQQSTARLRRLAPLFVGAFLDVVGNVLEGMLSFKQTWWLSWAAGIAWHVAVAAYSVGFLRLAVQGRHLAGERLRDTIAAPAALRLLSLLVAAMVGLLFLGKIGVQSEDLLERWFDGQWSNAVVALVGFLSLVALVRVSRLLPSKNSGHPSALGLIGGGLVIGVIGAWLRFGRHDGAGTLVLGGIVLATGVVSVRLSGQHAVGTTSGESKWEPRTPELEVDQPWLRSVIAGAPFLVLGLMSLRTGTNRLSLVGFGQSPLLLLVLGAVALLLACWAAWYAGAEAPVPVTEPAAGLALTFTASALVLAVLMAEAAASSAVARAFGVFGVIGLGMAFVAAMGFAIRAGLSANTTPFAFSRMGFSRTPVATILLVWVVVASQINGGTNNSKNGAITYYNAHLIAPALVTTSVFDDATKTTIDACLKDTNLPEQKPPARIQEAFCKWLPTAPVGAGGRKPLVLATAGGGGVRAAGWTAAVLDCLLFRATPTDCSEKVTAAESAAVANKQSFGHFASLFAANGASGGSVGIASTVAQRIVTAADTGVAAGWVGTKVGGDPLAPTVANAAVFDAFLGLFGVYIGDDRTRELETQWASHWSEPPLYCGIDVTGTNQLGFVMLRKLCKRPLPLMLFNGTNVSDGRRVDIAPFDVNQNVEEPGITVAYDLDEYVCGHDVELFTAAFLSARFPLVSSSGRIADRCETKQALNVVDGGYGENDGAAQIGEVWDQLAPIIMAYNKMHKDTEVVPVLLEIKTGEAGAVTGNAGSSSTWGEFLRPLQAILNVLSGRDSDAEELLVSSFNRLGGVADMPAFHLTLQMYEHPGRTQPLGWTLSSNSIADLFTQLGVGRNKEFRCTFAKLFDGAVACAS
jgi:hypothetical protein